jgi:hypothetical protein
MAARHDNTSERPDSDNDPPLPVGSRFEIRRLDSASVDPADIVCGLLTSEA